MRKVLKRIASVVLIPLTKWYLTRKRRYSKAGINVSILPGVFHPGLFSSTNLLREFLNEQDLEGKTLLELGCGTGFLSIVAAKKGARVTASDVSQRAIENTRMNAQENGVHIEIIESDLFDSLPSHSFDWIVINPPYYAKKPINEADCAWYCGENFEYFGKLFAQLLRHRDSNIIMVLTLECDLDQIFSLAEKSGVRLTTIRKKKNFFDGKHIIYRIHPT